VVLRGGHNLHIWRPSAPLRSAHPQSTQKSGKRYPTMPTSEKRLDYICEVEASSRFGGVGPDAAECEKDHHGRERLAAGGNGQVTPASDETRPLRVTPSGAALSKRATRGYLRVLPFLLIVKVIECRPRRSAPRAGRRP